MHNCNFALELMDDAGLPKAKARAEGECRNKRIEGFFSQLNVLPIKLIRSDLQGSIGTQQHLFSSRAR